MNGQNNRELKALFESAYEPTSSSEDFVKATLVRRRVQRRRHMMLAMAIVALIGFVTVSNVQNSNSVSASGEAWAAELDDFYDEIDEYQTSLLEESEGLDDLPTETYAYIQLIENQFEEN